MNRKAPVGPPERPPPVRTQARPTRWATYSNRSMGELPKMFTRFALVSTLCLVAFAATANGAGLPVPTVEYSADRVMETEAGTFEGKVYAAKDKERSETSMQGMTSVMILRRDKQLGYMLMPAQKMYSQMDFAKAQQQTHRAK